MTNAKMNEASIGEEVVSNSMYKISNDWVRNGSARLSC